MNTREDYEVKNAIISGASITNDDHNCLVAWVRLDYGGSEQGFGGHILYLPKTYKHHDRMAGAAGHFIWRVMEVAGVTEWGKLQGKTVRARANCGGVQAIGHIVKDDWFEPAVDFAANEAVR